jgi:hypothetical protein
MLSGVILTRGALEIAEEVRPFLELDDEIGEAEQQGGTEMAERIEFAILLEEAAMASTFRH